MRKRKWSLSTGPRSVQRVAGRGSPGPGVTCSALPSSGSLRCLSKVKAVASTASVSGGVRERPKAPDRSGEAPGPAVLLLQGQLPTAGPAPSKVCYFWCSLLCLRRGRLAQGLRAPMPRSPRCAAGCRQRGHPVGSVSTPVWRSRQKRQSSEPSPAIYAPFWAGPPMSGSRLQLQNGSEPSQVCRQLKCGTL